MEEEVGAIDPYKVVPPCHIDPDGTFKYIQIALTVPWSSNPVIFVRGFKKFAYHMNIFEHFEQTELPLIIKANGGRTDGIAATCPGGGRIEHKSGEKSVFIYGYSQSYGQPDHTVAQKIVQEAFGAEYKVTWSNEGY
ncbi:hypothetical protein FGO68_gene6312 [Halteria grandinella]|uniref:Uncharacterized protein n=1 Tax=Halteria grandinella TaxID=5974 RepID=A0A8J8NLG2_HALGN|nr:hypothetical protein FGO68_gene6312 [Halteria grandinella]